MTGWAQEDNHAKGFLLMEVARYLCEDSGGYNGAESSSPVNQGLNANFKDGKRSLESSQCKAAMKIAENVQKLVDLVA